MDTDQLQRLDQFLGDPQVPQEDKNRAVAMARTADSNPDDGSTAVDRAGGYVEKQANRFASSAQNLFADVTGQAQPAGRTWKDTGQDALTVGGPVVAPGLAAAGIGVGAGVRALGADEETADVANMGTQLVGGVGNAVYQGGKAAAGLKGVLSGRYNQIAEGAANKGLSLAPGSAEGQSLKAALERSLERFAPNTNERHVAEGLIAKLAPEAGTTPLSGGPTYEQLDDAMTNLQGIPRASAIAGMVKAARNGLLRGTPEGASRAATDAAYRLAGKPLPMLARGALGAVGGGGAILEAKRGNYGKMAGALALGALGGGGAGVGQMLAGARGAAGPLARTAIGVGSAREAALGDEGPDAPGSPDTAPEAPMAPQTAPASQPAAQPAQVVQGRYGREIGAVASLVKIPPEVIQHFMGQESGGNPKALSHPSADQVQTPAHGLMQVTPGTFAGVQKQVEFLLGRPASVDNPLDNLVGGALLLRRYLDKSDGDIGLTAKLYHGGENPAAWGPHTEQYSQDILRRFAENR